MIDFITGASLVTQIVMGILALLVALFAFRFLPKAIFLKVELDNAIRVLNEIKGSRNRDLHSAFSASKTLKALWLEYFRTLHKQREPDPAKGELKTVALWSTVPAAMIFTTEAVVDTRLETEFYKHLPGIFTGVGIIGTFWGLIQGLQSFQVSEDQMVARKSLEALMLSVSHAFIVSAAAILAAMVATFLEKVLVTALYGKVEKIASLLDAHESPHFSRDSKKPEFEIPRSV